MKMRESSRERFHVPVDRLNQALRRSELVDQAIDLGIAIEGVFLEGTQEERIELSYRASIRAAFLLGENPQRRREIRDIFRDLYKLRSIAVHQGKVDQSPHNQHLIETGWQLTARAIGMCIENWQIDWNKLVFG
jgi:hypothetical protein